MPDESESTEAPDYPELSPREAPGLVDVSLSWPSSWPHLPPAWPETVRPALGQGGGDEVIRLWANRSLGLGSDMYLVEVGDRCWSGAVARSWRR
jgi:hypothetical protein